LATEIREIARKAQTSAKTNSFVKGK